jgi:hypothetical protein
MLIKGYFHETEKFYTKALRVFKKGRGTAKLIISYSKAKMGKWHDNNMVARNFGYFKSKELMFTARALVIGKHKFSLLIAHD